MKIYRFLTSPIQVNTYLVNDEKGNGFIVDPGGYERAITRRAKELGIDVQYIILTHGHGDHIGGVAGFLEDFTEAKVVAYEGEAELLNDSRLNSSAEIFGYGIKLDADIYVSEGDTLDIGDITLKFVHTPGHTKGGMCLITDGYAFTGDTIFRESIGRTDFYGGDFDQLIQSIRDKIFTLDDATVLLPGHMGETTVGHEKRYNPFVQG